MRVRAVERPEAGLTVVLAVGNAGDGDHIARQSAAMMEAYGLASEITVAQAGAHSAQEIGRNSFDRPFDRPFDRRVQRVFFQCR